MSLANWPPAPTIKGQALITPPTTITRQWPLNFVKAVTNPNPGEYDIELTYPFGEALPLVQLLAGSTGIIATVGAINTTKLGVLVQDAAGAPAAAAGFTFVLVQR